MKPGLTYYCSQCGSNKIEVHMYVNVNTLEVEDNPEWDYKTPCWCIDCNDNSTITDDPNYYKEWLEINAGEEKFEANRENDKV